MRAIVITRPGGPDVLEEQSRPLPTPGLSAEAGMRNIFAYTSGRRLLSRKIFRGKKRRPFRRRFLRRMTRS